MKVYCGELCVKNDEFTLEVERLIIGDGEVRFSVFGTDGDGAFVAEGAAIKMDRGNYISQKLTLSYSGQIDRNSGVVHFNLIKPTPKLQKCKIEGMWVIGEDSWTFSGNLKKFMV